MRFYSRASASREVLRPRMFCSLCYCTSLSSGTHPRRPLLHRHNRSETIRDYLFGRTSATSSAPSSGSSRRRQTEAVEARIHKGGEAARAEVHPKAGCTGSRKHQSNRMPSRGAPGGIPVPGGQLDDVVGGVIGGVPNTGAKPVAPPAGKSGAPVHVGGRYGHRKRSCRCLPNILHTRDKREFRAT